jgi:hypothetical protein
MSGEIPKLDIRKSIHMKNNIDAALKESLNNVQESENYIICELKFDIIDMIDMYFSGKMIPPIFWMYKNSFLTKQLEAQDAELLGAIYKSSIFEFFDIVIYKEMITNAYKVDANKNTLQMYSF